MYLGSKGNWGGHPSTYWEGEIGVRDAVVTADMAVDITENENEVMISRDKFEGRALIRCRNLEIDRCS